MSYYIKYLKYHNQVVVIVITLIFFSHMYMESNSPKIKAYITQFFHGNFNIAICLFIFMLIFIFNWIVVFQKLS